MTATNENYRYHYKYPHPSVTTDCVIFGYDGSQLKLLLVERGIEPYRGQWAFPGGFLRMDETAEEGALRELYEETGLRAPYIRQFHTFSDPNRDPRERIITIAFYALVRISEVKGADDAAKAQWFPLDELPPLAFDHNHILEVAVESLRRQIHFEPIGFELLPEQFTMKQLQHLYEIILGVTFDRRNFHNKMLHLNMLTELDTLDSEKKKKPFLYKFNEDSYKDLKLKKGFRLEF